MREFSASPVTMVTGLWRNRELIYASTKREVLGRYRGSAFGLLWSFFNPLLMLAVYTFVFSEIFKARWGGGGGSKGEFALALFVGLMVFNVFAECINRAPTIILSNPNYVKKIVYPLEILPFINLLAALYHGLISLGIWLGAYLLLMGVPHATVLYLPLVILPLCLLIMGFSWILASLGLFLRDISQVIGVVTTALMFMSAIFYPLASLPVVYRKLFDLNPLAAVIEQTRDILLWGKSPDFVLLGIWWIAAFFIAWLGFVWFQKTRIGFADVL